MSGRARAEQGFGSKSGIKGFLGAFEDCERFSFSLPEGVTNYVIAELVYGADNTDGVVSRDTSFAYPDYVAVHIAMANRKNMTMVFQWNQYVRRRRRNTTPTASSARTTRTGAGRTKKP